MEAIRLMKDPDEWAGLLTRFPPTVDLEATARATKAFKRARGLQSAQDLLRLILVYCTCGLSLRTTAAWAQGIDLCDISDVAVLKRIRKAVDWLRLLVANLLEVPDAPSPPLPGVRPVYLVDGTYIKGRVAGHEDWRIHTCFDARQLSFHSLELTDTHGAEDLQRFRYPTGSIVIADRGYAKAKQLQSVVHQGSDYIVRMGLQSLALRNQDGSRFMLVNHFATLTDETPVNLSVYVASNNRKRPEFLRPARLIIVKKDAANTARSTQQVRRKAQKNQHHIHPDSLVAAGYFMVLTSLPEADYSAQTVLLLYRVRWQIELAFKRLKSLVEIDEFRAKDPGLVQACLYAGLLMALLLEGLGEEFQTAISASQRQKRNVSLWRTLTLLGLQVRSSMLGATQLQSLLNRTAKIWRNLCEPPRKRQLKQTLPI